MAEDTSRRKSNNPSRVLQSSEVMEDGEDGAGQQYEVIDIADDDSMANGDSKQWFHSEGEPVPRPDPSPEDGGRGFIFRALDDGADPTVDMEQSMGDNGDDAQGMAVHSIMPGRMSLRRHTGSGFSRQRQNLGLSPYENEQAYNLEHDTIQQRRKNKGKQPVRPKKTTPRKKKKLKRGREKEKLAKVSESEITEAGGWVEPNLDFDLDDEPYALSQQSQQSSQKFAITENQDEQIASFIEGCPAFYDMTNPDYKNKIKKSAWLKQAARVIGVTPRQILTRFRSMRTDYFKLKRKVAGKLGQGHTKLTALQEFKLRRYQFLDAHYRGKDSSRLLGSVRRPESRLNEDEVNDLGSSAGAGARTNSERKHHDSSESPTPTKGKKGMVEVLMELLSNSQKELRQSQAPLPEATSSAGSSGMSERDAWAQWLASLQQEIPKETWRAYQKETFDVAMRYAMGAQQDQQPPPQPRMPHQQPPPQHQNSLQQQPRQCPPVSKQEFAQPVPPTHSPSAASQAVPVAAAGDNNL